MARKSTIDSARFAPIKGDPKRNYVDKSTGKIVSRRQATQLSIGQSLEKRAKSNKQLQLVKPITKLPRKQKIKTTTGKVTDWRAMKAMTLQQVKEICDLLPPGAKVVIVARGIIDPKIDSPKMITKSSKGKRKDRLQWMALHTQFEAGEIGPHMATLQDRVMHNFLEVDYYRVQVNVGGN